MSTRLTEHDRNWGPFTLGKSEFKVVQMNYKSIFSEQDDHTGKSCNEFIIQLGGKWILRVKLPYLIKSFKEKVYPMAPWDEDTVKRLGRDHYFNYYSRKYGFYRADDGGVQFFYGIYAPFEDSERVKNQSSFYIPGWTMLRLVKNQILNPDGTVYWNDASFQVKGLKRNWNEEMDAKENCPKTEFLIKDYDDTLIKVSTYITYREYVKGDKNFKWLQYFTKKEHYRHLNINFDKEVGPSKGSWKGGMLGTSIVMLDGETALDTFKRFCSKEQSDRVKKYRIELMD